MKKTTKKENNIFAYMATCCGNIPLVGESTGVLAIFETEKAAKKEFKGMKEVKIIKIKLVI